MSSTNQKKYKSITNEDRERIVRSYINGNSAAQIVKVMGFCRTSVHGLIRMYTQGKDYSRKPKGGSKRRISDDQLNTVRSWVDEDCTIILKTLKEKIMNEMGINASLTTILSYLKEFHFSFKRVYSISQNKDSAPQNTNFVPQDNSLSTLETRAYYANFFLNQIPRIDDSKLFFINEATFSVTMRKKFKVKAIKEKKSGPLGRGFQTKDRSICCAMSKNGIVKYQTQANPFDTESFYQFVESIIIKFAQTNVSGAMIIMDTEYVDKDPNIRGLIGSNGHRLICLPSNSLFLNPIESMYSRWIQLIREKDPENEKELFEAIDSALSEISGNDCNCFYDAMLRFLPRCMRKEAILDY